MKKKQAKSGPKLIPDEILESAKASAGLTKAARGAKCRVCGSEAAPFSDEELCWVCRRLKISAWSEVESQISAQD